MSKSIYLVATLQEKITKTSFNTLANHNMLQFIFVGRLDPEKWVSHLIKASQKLLLEQQNIRIHIYGDGTLKPDIQQLATQYPQSILYYWRQDKSDIIKQWSKMDFFLMPSQFLETFWLTAAESLACNVPVIGNKKWWLSVFVDDQLNIQSYHGKDDGEKLYTLIKQLLKNKNSKAQFLNIKKHKENYYSKESRYKRIAPYLNKKKNISIVSDYINYDWWGIETHINDSIPILQQHHHITLYWKTAPSWKRASLKKLRSMAFSSINLYYALYLRRQFKNNNTKLVRRHSISRRIGWLSLYCCKVDTQIITHHELWLFHPYPSKVYEQTQIPKARSLWAFVRAGNSRNPLKVILLCGKYILIYLIHKQIKHKINTHIVPSERMIDVVKDRHPDANVVCVPHFVSMSR